MNKYTIFILILVLFTSCSKKTTPPVETIIKYDSIYIREVVRDTTISYQTQDNFVVVVDSSLLKTDLAISFAKILPDGKLWHSIKNRGFIPSKIIEKETYKDKFINKNKTITIKKEVKIPLYDKWFYLLLMYFIFTFVNWIRKKFTFV